MKIFKQRDWQLFVAAADENLRAVEGIDLEHVFSAVGEWTNETKAIVDYAHATVKKEREKEKWRRQYAPVAAAGQFEGYFPIFTGGE